MLRSNASRSILRSLNAAKNPAFKVTSSPLRQHFTAQICNAARRPQVLASAKPLSLVRYYADPIDKIDTKREAKIGEKKLPVTPETVSATSTTEVAAMAAPEEHDTQMLGGIKGDLKTIRDTFSLEEVPREAYWIGMAGVLPYLATSVSTLYCAWEINHAAATGTGFLLNERTAELCLHVLEPLQIGYGATIISFLGAIHWGLEFAGYGGRQGYPRYSIGVIGTALAWPTILLPAEYALISQFLIFNFLYYTDSRATQRGWCPPWYSVYRFVLTFIVGGSILLSLIGRGQIADRIGKVPGVADRIQALRDVQYQQLEEEEEARRKFLASKDEEEDDD